MKLSICMMVKNEEKNLPRCLEQLKPLTESGLAELIIIDTGSEDESEKIAKQYTNKVYSHRWNKNFSEMRNISISYAKGEWIFIIDADERLDDVEKLVTLMNSSEIEKYNTILVQVKNLYYVTDESKYNLIVSPRLFRNDGDFRYEGVVHNQPIFKGPNLNVDINLTHFGYITNDKKLMELKYNRTTELLKSELTKEPKDLYYMYQLGVSYDMHGDYKEALNEFRKAYSVLNKRSLEEKKMYVYIYASYSRIAYTNGMFNESIKIAKEALNLEQDYIDLYYLIGISEKQLRNNEDAFKYLNKYIDLFKKYNQLEISTDMSIIMYHIDDKSKSTAYFEIVKYYLDLQKYKEAYKVYNNISNVNEKIYASINTLIPLEKYSELRKIYSNITLDRDRNSFLCTLEEEIKKLEYRQKLDLYKEFSLNEDIYGLFNKSRISRNVDEKISLTKILIKEIDFSKEPIFYSEIFENIKDNIKLIINLFKITEVGKLKDIVKYLIEQKKFVEVFENYILEKDEVIENIEESKIFIAIADVLMLLYLKDNDVVSEKYLNIFKEYLNMGINFIKELYRVEKAEKIYKSISNEEDKFFMIMYIFNKLIKENNKKNAIKYMIEAVNTYEAFSKYIDVYKDEIFNLEEKNIRQEKNKEFEEYKLKVKENINNLINQGSLAEAKKLISEYEEIIIEDLEIYSMKAVICIMEENIDNAENILKEGLEKEPYNNDLLFNMSYLMDVKKKDQQALEYFCKAKLFNKDNNVKVEEIISNYKARDNSNLKILLGTMEIANQMNTMSKGMKKLGLNAKTLNYYPSYLGYRSDYNLDINSFKNINKANIETKQLASKMIAENDVFHFYFGTSLTLDYSDFRLLKELGKKVIMQYMGSDVRMYSKAIKLNKYVKVKDMNEEQIKRKLELISKYVPDCLVDYELAEYVKDYHSNIHYIRAMIDLNKYKFIGETHNRKFKIVHAPTAAEIKGTSYILKAIEELKEKYDFDFELVQGMPHEQATKIYEKADLIIDQILIGSYGLFAVESMAMGKPVICWISDFMREKYPKELPIISANPDDIKGKIEYVIKNKDMLKEIGIRSRMYVEKYHDMNEISKNMLDIYKKI